MVALGTLRNVNRNLAETQTRISTGLQIRSVKKTQHISQSQTQWLATQACTSRSMKV